MRDGSCATTSEVSTEVTGSNHENPIHQFGSVRRAVPQCDHDDCGHPDRRRVLDPVRHRPAGAGSGEHDEGLLVRQGRGLGVPLWGQFRSGYLPEPITDTQRSELQAALENSSLVEQVYYESSEEAFGRFQEQFANSPILENVTAAALPESFRIKLYNPEDYPAIANALSDAAGVEVVRDQKRLLDNFFTVLNGMQALALGVSAAMLVVTVLLVANTMRVSAFSRRRETGIMKLVGASNYYIRLPFLLEAGIAAAVGGIIASGALIGLKVFLIDRVLSPTFQFTAFIGWSDIHRVLPIVLATGISLAVLAAFFAIRRYLKV